MTKRAKIPPREDLYRTSGFTFRASEDGAASDGLTLDGYGAVFNRFTTIDSWEGRFKEQVAPGSMKKSFREMTPKIQFDHGRHGLIGSIPIAAFEPGFPREEVDPVLAPEGGAHVVARLNDNWLVQPVRDAIASESIDGMSFRFSVVREEWRDADGKKITDEDELMSLLMRSWMEDVPDEELLQRTLKELRVSEMGPVVWPAYTDTSVGVRSLTIDLSRLSEPKEQEKLARAVLMVGQREENAAPQGTSPDGDAAEHPVSTNDTPQGTSPDGDAAKHLSAAMRLRRQSDVEWARSVMKTIKKGKP